MNEYIKCPKCDLNYIKSNEKCCKACNPDMRGKLISDIEENNETYRQQKLAEYSTRKESMKAFYAIRYNCKHK